MSAEDYQTVFLVSDSSSRDPYNDSYKLNEDSHLNSSGRMVTPTKGTHHELIGASDVSVVQALAGDSDVDIKFNDKVSPKSVSWKDVMIADRKIRKSIAQNSADVAQCNF